MKKIGILEDDAVLSTELKYYLEANGYEVRLFSVEEYAGKDEEVLLTLMKESACHLILMDIGLPGIDGLHLCKEFCKSAETPVIMITSRDTELTELMSISNGADDFVTKPFRPQILLARMEAVMKRVYKDGKQSDKITVNCGTDSEKASFVVEFSKGRITKGQETVELSKNEILLLKLLIQKQGEIVTRDALMNELWDNCMFVDDNTLTVNMTRLKSKLETIGIQSAIMTKRGMGYLLL